MFVTYRDEGLLISERRGKRESTRERLTRTKPIRFKRGKFAASSKTETSVKLLQPVRSHTPSIQFTIRSE